MERTTTKTEYIYQTPQGTNLLTTSQLYIAEQYKERCGGKVFVHKTMEVYKEVK